jgi:iron complex outermembrane recepter protein
MSRNFMTFLSSGVAIAALASIAPAYAQDDVVQAAADEPVYDEIVVTATRDSRSLQDVPMSVNAVTSEQLAKLNILDTKDISRLAPGLELTNTTGRNNTTTLRGIGFDADQGTDPTVQIYFNEAPADAQTVFTAMYDIGQIEVLRGPQGLLRGLSSPGGSITITTLRPKFDEVEGYMQGTVTDRHAYNVQGGVTLPFNEKVSLRVAALVDGNRNNQVRNITNGDYSRGTTQSGRVTLGLRPTEDITAYLSYQYLQSDVRQYSQVVGAANDFGGIPTGPRDFGIRDRVAVSDGVNRFQNISHIVNLNVDWDLGFADLTGLAAYQSSTLDQQRDGDPANSIPGLALPQHTISPYRVPTFELRLASKNDGMFGWGVGAFYQKLGGTSRVTQDTALFFAEAPAIPGVTYLPITSYITAPTNQETISFNANGRVRAGGFTLEGGLRYTIMNGVREADIVSTSPGAPGALIDPFTVTEAGVPAQLRDLKERPLTGGATLSYEFSPTLTGYVAYGHSFRAGAVGYAAPVGISPDLVATQNEKTDNFEAGLKGSFFDRRVNFSVSAFYQTFDGFVSRFTGIYYNCPNSEPGVCAPGTIDNGADIPSTDGSFDFNYNGDATVKGIEASIDARPTDFWDLSINMSYVKARYKDNARLPCNDFDGDGRPDTDGSAAISGTGNVSFCRLTRMSDTPDFNLSATTELRIPVEGSVEPFVRGLLTYRPGVYSQQRNFNYRSRTLIDLFAGVRGNDGQWELTGFVKNVLNQQRISDFQNIPQVGTFAGPVQSGYSVISSTVPREFGLVGTFRW